MQARTMPVRIYAGTSSQNYAGTRLSSRDSHPAAKSREDGVSSIEAPEGVRQIADALTKF